MPLKRLENLEMDILTGSQVELSVFGTATSIPYQTTSGTVAYAGNSGTSGTSGFAFTAGTSLYAKTAGTSGFASSAATAGTLGTGAGLTKIIWGIDATGGTTIRLNFVNGVLSSVN